MFALGCTGRSCLHGFLRALWYKNSVQILRAESFGVLKAGYTGSPTWCFSEWLLTERRVGLNENAIGNFNGRETFSIPHSDRLAAVTKSE
jgi:hypothetical protein